MAKGLYRFKAVVPAGPHFFASSSQIMGVTLK